jgi:hypothetical protein
MSDARGQGRACARRCHNFHPRSRGPLRVDPCRLAADKIMRLYAQTPVIENGFVHLPDEAHRLAGASPSSPRFRPSATTTRSIRPHEALAWAKRPRTPGPEFWIELTFGPSGADGLWPTSKIVGLKGSFRADRILELDEPDAKPLLAAGWGARSERGAGRDREETFGGCHPRESGGPETPRQAPRKSIVQRSRSSVRGGSLNPRVRGGDTLAFAGVTRWDRHRPH